MSKQIIVVGAGIIGACAAYHLQKNGAQVTLVDAQAASASDASFGWINASFFENEDHFRLRADGIAAYHDLALEIPLPIDWSGCLCWETTGNAFDAQRDALRDLGYETQELNAKAFTQLEPFVGTPPERCLVFPQEGAAESKALVATLLNAAKDLGARIVTGVKIDGFAFSGARVTGVRTELGEMAADQVLVAAGIATQSLMASLDVHIPMLHRPALMLHTKPVAPVFRHVLVSEIGEVRQLADGSLMMPAAIDHQRDSSETLDGRPEDIAVSALARLQGMVPDVPLEWSHAAVSQRPVPQDGLPVAGFVGEGLYVATMHSGLTLGALAGKLIASEMMGGDSAGRLAPYRPSRFQN